METALADSIRRLLRVEGVELSLVIVDARRASRTPYRRRLRRSRGARQRVDVSDLFAEVPRIECTTVRSDGDGERFEPADLESIREHRLDFVLGFGFGDIRGEVLGVPTFGVWSYRHGDGERFRGGPPAFWEVYSGEPATGVGLERLTERPDAGIELQRCFVSTNPGSHRKTLDAVTSASSYMPARVARDILCGSARYLEAAPSPSTAPVRGAPTKLQRAGFLARMGGAWLKAQFTHVFLVERWHVGIVRRPIEHFLSDGFEPVIEWLPHRERGGFLADPFLAGTGTATHLLMERWDDRSERGTIVGVDLDGGMNGREPSPVHDSDVHMSYPYVFEHAGSLYCTPETNRRRGVFLYLLDPDGGGWKEQATLLEGFAAVDPTLVRHGDRWWLFCTDHEDDPDAKLLLWSAPQLLGPWEAHPGNPVKVDVRSSRPAGTPFVVDGELYRPAQDSGGGYGRAVVINRVTRLTTTEFAEEPVTSFSPPPAGPYGAGSHTIAGWGDLTAIDGKRWALASPRVVRPRLVRKLKRLAEKTGVRRVAA
jgi:hypothetical protein